MTVRFENPTPGAISSSHLALVVSVNDPDHRSRVQVRLLGFDQTPDHEGPLHDAPLWARVAVPFAGRNSGAFLLPDVGDEVLVQFVGGDPRMPVVVGSLWNGNAPAPERLGGDGDRIDRWSFVGRSGTRIAIVEEREGEETLRLSTPGDVNVELTASSGGRIELHAAGTTIRVDTNGVSVQALGRVQIQASELSVSAGQVTVDAAQARFSGMVECSILRATTVIGTTYTPGAGNIW